MMAVCPVFFNQNEGWMRIRLCFNKYLLASAFPSPLPSNSVHSPCRNTCVVQLLLLHVSCSITPSHSQPRSRRNSAKAFSGNLLWSCYFPGGAPLMWVVCRGNKMLSCQLLNGLSETKATTSPSFSSVLHSHG